MLKKIFITLSLITAGGIAGKVYAQDPPSGYTTNYGLSMWAQGATPGATALNANLTTIDAIIKAANVRIDQIRTYEINGKILTGDITITKADLGIDTTNYGGVPTSRTVNSKALTTNITLDKTDIGLGNVPNLDFSNAANISTGTLSAARLASNIYTTTNLDTSNIAFLSQNNTYTGSNTFATVTTDALTTKALSSTVTAIASSAMDWSLSNTFSKTISANTTFTFATSTSGQMVTVAITNTGSFTVTWPTVSWVAGTAPTQTTGAKTDIYTFIKVGSTIYGTAIQNF